MPPVFKSIGQTFIELETVDSTNNYATALLHEGMAQHGTVVFAHCQTAGRGQRNKIWLGNSGENIAMSVVLQPQGFILSDLFLWSMAVACGVHRFFEQHAGNGTKVKWPNDIYWRDRKAAGILIENNIAGSTWKYAIAGIGININQDGFEGLEKKATSLKNITGKGHNTVQLARELCTHLQWAYEALKNPEFIRKYYNEQLYGLNKIVRLKKGPKIFETQIKGVTPGGQLITKNAVEELFTVGEVEWLID